MAQRVLSFLAGAIFKNLPTYFKLLFSRRQSSLLPSAPTHRPNYKSLACKCALYRGPASSECFRPAKKAYSKSQGESIDRPERGVRRRQTRREFLTSTKLPAAIFISIEPFVVVGSASATSFFINNPPAGNALRQEDRRRPFFLRSLTSSEYRVCEECGELFRFIKSSFSVSLTLFRKSFFKASFSFILFTYFVGDVS